MKILLTNDDGIAATGLHVMRRALLEVPGAERDGERTSLRALVDGLTLAICLHGLTPEAAHETLSAHLDRLDRRSQPLDRAG